MMKTRAVIAAVIVVVLWTASCAPAAPATLPGAATPAPPAAAAGTAGESGGFGVSFQVDPALATGVEPQLREGVIEDEGMTYLLLPQHLAFTFSGSYADAEPLLQRQQLNLETMPQIVVYPAAAYAAIHPLARAQVELLQALLAERPAVPGGTMPYLPLHNAAQVFHSQLAYLTFANGAGVRYVTAFAQDASPVTNGQLLYTFQGLTDDGQYYVAAFFPVNTAALPDTPEVDDPEAFNANYAAYVAETSAALDGLSAGDFTPDLTPVDAVARSLRVEPDVALTGAEPDPPAAGLPLIQPPGVYQVYDGDAGLYRLYRQNADGTARQVAERAYPLAPAPDAARAVYADEARRLWLVDLDGGGERQLAAESDLSWLHAWGDADTLLVGVYLTAAEAEGLSVGHVALLDVDSGDLQVLDPEHQSLGRPAMAPDGQAVAYDLSAASPEASGGQIYRPDGGSRPLDPALFAGMAGEPACRLYNPAWSPDGRQLAWLCAGEAGARLVVFDLVRETAMTLFSWQPAQFGALPPSPVWSSDGRSLAVEIWANNDDESGLWVLPADGTFARLHVDGGRDPVWLNPTQLFYADLDENMNGDIKLFDLDYGRDVGVVDLPGARAALLLPYVSGGSNGP